MTARRGCAKEAAGMPLEHGRRRRARSPKPCSISPARRSVTGQMIAVDGGQHIGWRTPDIIEK